MKKMISVLLSIGLLLCMVACGQETAAPEAHTQRPPVTSTEALSEASAEEVTVTTEPESLFSPESSEETVPPTTEETVPETTEPVTEQDAESSTVPVTEPAFSSEQEQGTAEETESAPEETQEYIWWDTEEEVRRICSECNNYIVSAGGSPDPGAMSWAAPQYTHWMGSSPQWLYTQITAGIDQYLSEGITRMYVSYEADSRGGYQVYLMFSI